MIDIAAKVNPVLTELRKLGPAIGKAAEASALRSVRREVAPHILALAKTKVPMLFRVLLGSGAFHNVPNGAAITFGGMASGYAERQHEDTSLSHSGPRQGNWVYQGFDLSTFRVGDWNLPRQATMMGLHRGVIGLTAKGNKARGWVTTGGRLYTGKITGKRWRYSIVHYVKRAPASRFGHKVGQAHFLYGASNSAWEQSGEWAVRTLIAAALAGAKAATERVSIAAGGSA